MNNPDSSNASTPAPFSPASENNPEGSSGPKKKQVNHSQSGSKRKREAPANRSSNGTIESKSTNSKRDVPRKRKRTQDKPPKPPVNRNFSEKGVPNGSYKKYNRRRDIGPNDSRLPLLVKDWTSNGGQILDIGCNDGALTTFIAQRFTNARIVGVDIDDDLVNRARQRITDKMKAFEKQEKNTTAKKNSNSTDGSESKKALFPYNLTFTVEDVCNSTVSESVLGEAQYDIITAFSVVKWLHMHSGDDGLKQLFKRVYKALKPGGVFVMEPQPTKSYKAARRKGAVAAHLTVDKFKFKPDMFGEWLTSQCEFERMETLRERLPKNTPFGTRPVYAFFKAKQ